MALDLAEFAEALARRNITLRFQLAQEHASMAADLEAIRNQILTLKELIMSLVTDLQAKLSTANATMAAAVLTIQQLRQAHDAALEALALAQQTPPLPAGAVILTADEQAALAAMNASLPDSAQALADAIEANALNQTAAPAPAPAPASTPAAPVAP